MSITKNWRYTILIRSHTKQPLRTAFQNLLATFAKFANWTLIPEQTLSNGKRPDGTMRDTFNLPRRYWEAKDTKDDLNTEIRKKINVSYPISNTIFEDTRRAVLYQNNKSVLEANLTQPKELTNVLDCSFTTLHLILPPWEPGPLATHELYQIHQAYLTLPTGCATRFQQASGEVESGSRWRAGHFVSY